MSDKIEDININQEIKPSKQARRGRQSNPTKEDFTAPKVEEVKKEVLSLEELDAMPLKTYNDYLKYNDAVRVRRKALRKKDVEYMYAPLHIVECVKAKITRKSNRGLPININLRNLRKAVWFQSPKNGFKDGDVIEMPKCLVDEINDIAEPKYKQIKYPDGSFDTVLDYMDEKYSVQVLMS